MVEMTGERDHHVTHLGMRGNDIGRDSVSLKRGRAGRPDGGNDGSAIQRLGQRGDLAAIPGDLKQVTCLNLTGKRDRIHPAGDEIPDQILEWAGIFRELPFI